ncbi:hypothetical protein DY000_02039391 [Brassica cretica]|uniref:FBD domain-containing protein n=1 Tax=Brassica cretica TaxID=69181 RepID=A0ABQ7B9J8_BRACR|nr:hypothetical protein DY000_02039391 [Brassica cretica]
MDLKRRKNGKENEVGGAINKLPEDLRCHILSFLSTKDAALTSVLSKSWRDLFTLIPSLDLDDSTFMPDERPEECERTSFMEFVNRVLALHSNSPITKFSVRCHKGVDSYLVGDWIVKALRRGATDVTLILLFPSRLLHTCTHPNIFFHGQNLIKLKVGCGGLGPFQHSLFREDVIFTKLRTLHLNSIDISRHYGDVIFARLLSKCPVLEELIVNCIKWHGWKSGASVSSSTLKRLTIDCEHYYHESDYMLRHGPDEEDSDNLGEPLVVPAHFGTQKPRYVSFYTPNLIYLNYADFVALNYPLVKLDSLVEARLDVGPNQGQMRARDSDEFQAPWDATNLIMGIHNVQTLHLTSDTLEVIADFCKMVPVFHNLNHLSIESDDERGWHALPLLLINCPSLQTLVFHGLYHRVTDGCGDACDCISPWSSSSCLSSCPVKILNILNFGATCGEMSLVKHFLKKMPLLEQLAIVLDLDASLEEDLHLSQVFEDLRMAPRASPKCKLEVVNY